MQLQIRDMRPEDQAGKSYVHWKSWHETYPGMMDERYLARHTLEKCQEKTRKWPGNTVVAELDGKIVGFSVCSPRQDSDCATIAALYVLKEAQGLGIGRKLLDAVMQRLGPGEPVVLWVLKGNDHAIGFYEHCGFRLDGVVEDAPVGTEFRMRWQPNDP